MAARQLVFVQAVIPRAVAVTHPRRRLTSCDEAHAQPNEKQEQETKHEQDDEQDLGDAAGGACESGEAQRAGHQRENKRSDRERIMDSSSIRSDSHSLHTPSPVTTRRA